MDAPGKMPLAYWLNTRTGFYDPRVLNRIRSAEAWSIYVKECERRYQQEKERELNEQVNEAGEKLRSLDREFKEWMQESFFSQLYAQCKGDLNRVAEILKQPVYQKLIDHYEARERLYEQYFAQQKGLSNN